MVFVVAAATGGENGSVKSLLEAAEDENASKPPTFLFPDDGTGGGGLCDGRG